MFCFNLTGGTAQERNDLLVELVRIFSRDGLRVSAAVAAPNGFDPDKPGKDSYEHRRAGAKEVALASELRWAIMAGTKNGIEGAPNPLERLETNDLLLLSGFEDPDVASLRILDDPQERPSSNAKALASRQGGGERRAVAEGQRPHFRLTDREEIAAFILSLGGFRPT